MCAALKSSFPSRALSSSEIRVVVGKVEEHLSSHQIDCIVSSSNAFGLSDHGFDRSVCSVFGASKQRIRARLQQRIIDGFDGEQPVGSCVIVETGHPRIPYWANAPTRRVNYSVKGSDNVYVAIKALCHRIRR